MHSYIKRSEYTASLLFYFFLIYVILLVVECNTEKLCLILFQSSKDTSAERITSQQSSQIVAAQGPWDGF